ncbi:ABC transporter ATP-binding protein [Paracoccus suum]|uniref:ABC transporter ATP-binding protein n=1 Tax=Paracoccus suum TaxID=2259340 RepID=A0A344PMY8_9RHOB|nr:ABC transporter ATP-binding protein [Paracoccus suum]AXC50743.1 ABC transporter ATP-binding protein [Paracoccus suum]
MTAPLLKVENLHTRFRSEDGTLDAVRDVSFSLAPGETLGLVGESGSGKSVTGFSIMGLIDPPGEIAGGRIMFRDRDLTQLPAEEMRRLRGNRIAMVFQDPMMTLNPVLMVGTQMIEAIQAHERVGKAAARARARDALGAMGIPSPEARLDAYPHQMSGGMRQRVAIATALLNHPDLIIADEPTTALDVSIQAQILAEVQELTRKRGMALIWITHDLSVIAGIADSIAVMYAGRIVEQGDVDAVLDRTRHPYTAGLIGSLPGSAAPGSMLTQIQGTTPSLLNPPQGCAFHPRCARMTPECLRQPAPEAGADHHMVRCFNPLTGDPSQPETAA